MRRRFIIILSFFLFFSLFFGMFFERPLLAEKSLEEIKQKIEERNSKLKELQEKEKVFRRHLKSSRVFAQTLKEQLKKDTLWQESLNNSIKISQERIEILSLEIEKLNLEIERLGKELEEKKEKIKEIITKIYENDQTNLLEIFLSQKNFSDFLDEGQNLISIESSLQEKLKIIQKEKREIVQKKDDLQRKKEEQLLTKENYQAKLEIAKEAIKNRKKLLRKTKNKERNYQILLKKIEEQRIAIAKEINDLEEELRKKIDITSLPKPVKGLIDWPANGSLTQGYGRTAFALKHYHSRFHNGIDIGLSIGSPIRAVAKGKVVALGNQDRYCWRGAYGKFVAVKHPNNLVSFYAHLSLIKVRVGQEVERGEIIGYSGNTGYSTGPHLHFGLYDASTFFLKESRFCGPMPVGGSINPLDYLPER